MQSSKAMCIDGSLVCSVSSGPSKFEFHLVEIQRKGPTNHVLLAVQVRRCDEDKIVDIAEVRQPCTFERAGTTAVDEAMAEAAVAARLPVVRSYLQELAATASLVDLAYAAADAFAFTVRVASYWAVHGPPAERARGVPKGRHFDSLRRGTLKGTVLLFTCGEWVLEVRPPALEMGFGTISIAKQESPNDMVVVARSAQSLGGHLSPIDGDADQLRDLVQLIKVWLQEVDADVAFRDWLEFREIKAIPTCDVVDWRLEQPNDGIVDWSFLDESLPARRAQLAEGIRTHYHPFLRDSDLAL
ncbi:MAG: hypothetical protein AAGE52_06335 [Myxococcota bacterium]